MVFEPKASLICSYRTLGHLSIFLIDVVNSFFEKRIHNTFQIRGDKTQRHQNSFKQSKICRLLYEMDRIVLFRIIF